MIDMLAEMLEREAQERHDRAVERSIIAVLLMRADNGKLTITKAERNLAVQWLGDHYGDITHTYDGDIIEIALGMPKEPVNAEAEG